MNKSDTFSKRTISLHWLIAIGMIGSLFFGIYIEDLPKSPETGQLIGLHKSIGLLVLTFALLRIANTLKTGLPSPLSPAARWQFTLAKGIHLLLLVGTVLMPISGMFMSVGGGHSVAFFGIELISKIPKNELLGQIGHVIHSVGGNLILAAIAIHVAGAINHSLIDQDGTMKRMLGKGI